MIEVDGRRIDYQEAGEGPAVLFLPGSFSTPSAWRPIQQLLPPAYRFIGTSLCGYGGTEETRGEGDHGIEHELRVVEAVARKAGAPVHLVGHSYGASIALAAALAGNIDVRSIATFEANPPALITDRGRADVFEDMLQMNAAYEADVRDGKKDAVSRVIDYWGGEGVFAAMPEKVQSYCRETTPANVLDWRTVFDHPVGKAEFSQLDMPALVARGAHANQAMIEITEGLGEWLPDVRKSVVADAGHFLITTHPEECAGLLGNFLAEVAT